MERKFDNWLDSYVSLWQKSETPEAFDYWGGIMILSSVIGRNVYLNREHYNLYPNFYVLLVGDSGTRKSSVLRRIKNTIALSKSAVRFASWDAPEKIYKIENFTNVSVFLLTHNVNFLRDITLIEMLYSNPETIELRGDSEDKIEIEKSFTNIITCIDNLEDVENEEVIDNGRFIIAKGDSSNSQASVHSPSKETEEDLVKDLKEINSLEGTIQLTETAKGIFKELYQSIQRGKRKKDSTYYARKSEHLLKLSIILSVSKRSNLKVTNDDLITAYGLLNLAEESINR